MAKAVVNQEDKFAVAEARNIEEAKQLLSKGYEFEMDYGNVKLFKKRR